MSDMNSIKDAELGNVSGGAGVPPTHYQQKIGYRVKAGDNLTKIAGEFSVTIADLVRWNGIQNPDRIFVGDTLAIYK